MSIIRLAVKVSTITPSIFIADPLSIILCTLSMLFIGNGEPPYTFSFMLNSIPLVSGLAAVWGIILFFFSKFFAACFCLSANACAAGETTFIASRLSGPPVVIFDALVLNS